MDLSYEVKDSYAEITAPAGSNGVRAETTGNNEGSLALWLRPGYDEPGSDDFMDSSGLGALIGSPEAARRAIGNLRNHVIRAQVKMVLDLPTWTKSSQPTPPR